MTSAWAAVLVSVLVVLGTIGRELMTRARHEGKLDAILEQLTEITGDHELRIRALETRGPTTAYRRTS